MRRQLSQVHLVLVITFGLYMAYTNLAAATPLRDYIMIYMCLGELILATLLFVDLGQIGHDLRGEQLLVFGFVMEVPHLISPFLGSR